MKNFWEHQKIEEFLNDEDIFVFLFEREEKEKIKKIKDENKKKFLIENIKIKKIKNLLADEKISFKELIFFLQNENMEIKNLFFSQKIQGFRLKKFIENPKSYIRENELLYNVDYYIIANDTGSPVHRDRAYLCKNCGSLNEYYLDQVQLKEKKEFWCDFCVQEDARKHQGKLYSIDKKTLEHYGLELYEDELDYK